MCSKPADSSRPTSEVDAARTFYSGLGLDVDYFPALWHTFNVGHMLETELDALCRRFGLSLADFNLMGALRIDRHTPMRATDLAVTLQVSNAALSARIERLAQQGLLERTQMPDDRRASQLQLTQAAGNWSRASISLWKEIRISFDTSGNCPVPIAQHLNASWVTFTPTWNVNSGMYIAECFRG